MEMLSTRESVEEFRRRWEAIQDAHPAHIIVTRPALAWQTTFPTQDGYYWFWGAEKGKRIDEPFLAEVLGSNWSYCGSDDIWKSQTDFPGFCAGPLLPPPAPET